MPAFLNVEKKGHLPAREKIPFSVDGYNVVFICFICADLRSKALSSRMNGFFLTLASSFYHGTEKENRENEKIFDDLQPWTKGRGNATISGNAGSSADRILVALEHGQLGSGAGAICVRSEKYRRSERKRNYGSAYDQQRRRKTFKGTWFFK